MSRGFTELAYQAKLFNGMPAPYNEVMKFAELLVQECADYIDAFNRENMVEEGISGDMLKKHFGVEE